MAFPSDAEYKQTVSNEISKECPVATEAIKNAEMTFGKDMHERQGKTTRQKPPSKEEMVKKQAEVWGKRPRKFIAEIPSPNCFSRRMVACL